MRIENENVHNVNVLNAPLIASDFLLGNNEKQKLTAEIKKLGQTSSLAENPLLAIPPKFIFNDVKKKFKAGFERWIYGTRELRIYIYPFANVSNLPKINKFNKNSLEDIFQYKQTSLSQPSRKNFLKLVENRFEKGMTVYTYAEENALQSYIWLDPNPQNYYGSGVDQEIVALPKSLYVQDAYTNPFARAKGLAQAGFCQLAHDAAQIAEKDCLYLAVFGTNVASRHAVEKLGTELKTSYFCKTRFGFRKTWKIEHR
ncbi:MAG TPA: hypothetical protein PKY59_09285 [Pyrinomonadaceae bacterium]|nr:hypothetical protein [Pyrinomonadaceae bacterium]